MKATKITKLYILSGLGADEQVFQLMDFSAFEVVFICWKQPRKNERIENYAHRLAKEIDTEKPILVGLSFGGIMAIEIAKHIATEKVILLASAKTKNEIPLYYKLVAILGLHHLLPASLMKSANALSYWFFGANTKFEKQLLKQILQDTDPVFLKWAVNEIVHWKNSSIPENTFHIHGTADRILPIRNIDADVVIAGGGHFMTLNKPEELIEELKRIIL